MLTLMGIPELGLAIASGDGEGGRSGQASVLVISGFFFLESRFGDPEVRKCHALLLCILVVGALRLIQFRLVSACFDLSTLT